VYTFCSYLLTLYVSTVPGTEGIEQTSNPPPPVPAQAKQDIASSSQTGTHAAGQDASAAPSAEGPAKPKTEKECQSWPSKAVTTALLTENYSREGAQEGREGCPR
jgi:hypothetical protein